MARSRLILAVALPLLGVLLLGALQDSPASQQDPDPDRPSVSVIRVEEPITPTTTDYITRALAVAQERGSTALLIELDTPGGLLESTRDIVQAFFAPPVPIIVYVSPAGARAASAGTFITMAAHVAAMAPSTTIGAASPVTMGPGGGSAQPDTVMQRKLFSFTESFIETIAERRGRDVEWAISAVAEGASATEREALERNVIDLVAADRDELLRRIDGRVVEGDTLLTADAEVVEVPKTLAERFLGFIVRPELMLVLTLIAMYGIIGEVTNPGAIVPGTAGVVALILLLYASAAMPVNLAGYVLIGLSILLFVSEAFTPTFGILTGAGSVAFFLGGLMLFQDLPEGLELSWAWLLPATILTAAFFVWIATAGLRIQLAPSRTGPEAMIGQRATVIDAVDRAGGRVFVSGEYWNAVSDQEIGAGEACRIEALDGLTLKVGPFGASGPTGRSDPAERSAARTGPAEGPGEGPAEGPADEIAGSTAEGPYEENGPAERTGPPETSGPAQGSGSEERADSPPRSGSAERTDRSTT